MPVLHLYIFFTLHTQTTVSLTHLHQLSQLLKVLLFIYGELVVLVDDSVVLNL